MNERLLHLAGLKGIARSYNDFRGQAQNASERTLTRLLVAMNVLAADDPSPAGVEAAIGEHERRQRDECLPPVLVLYEDQPS